MWNKFLNFIDDVIVSELTVFGRIWSVFVIVFSGWWLLRGAYTIASGGINSDPVATGITTILILVLFGCILLLMQLTLVPLGFFIVYLIQDTIKFLLTGESFTLRGCDFEDIGETTKEFLLNLFYFITHLPGGDWYKAYFRKEKV